MRIHYAEQGKEKTLCGALVQTVGWYKGFTNGKSNLPRILTNKEEFEKVRVSNQCITCKKKLVQLTFRREKIGRKQFERWLHKELQKEFEKKYDEELPLMVHEALWGVPIGPTLEMLKPKLVDFPIPEEFRIKRPEG
jgi:hypothetical protein